MKVKESSFNGRFGEPEIGEPTKTYSYAPSEREIKQVTRTTITRKTD